MARDGAIDDVFDADAVVKMREDGADVSLEDAEGARVVFDGVNNVVVDAAGEFRADPEGFVRVLLVFLEEVESDVPVEEVAVLGVADGIVSEGRMPSSGMCFGCSDNVGEQFVSGFHGHR